MRILFVYPNISRQTTPQVGVASLMGALRNHDIKLFDLTEVRLGDEINSYRKEFEQFSPDVVLVSCRSNEWGFAKVVSAVSFPVPVIIGGIHATICPDEVIEHTKMLVRGEGEEAIVELIDKLENHKDITNIKNVWVKHRGKIHKNELRPLLTDLDKLPIPGWEYFKNYHFEGSYVRDLFKEVDCVGTFEASRGCPYSCSYCSNDFLQDLYKGLGSYHRKKSPQRVVKEIAEFKKQYPSCNFLYYIDETFMIEGEWLREYKNLCDKTPYVFMTRPEMVTEKKMKLVAESGGKAVSIGIESGNEKLRKEVLKRNMSDAQIIRAFKIAKDYGLRVYSFNMVGLPFETERDILSTIELNKKIKPDIAQFTIFFPLRGTKLFDICVKEGYMKPDEYPSIFNYYTKSILNLPNFKEGELPKWVQRAQEELKLN